MVPQQSIRIDTDARAVRVRCCARARATYYARTALLYARIALYRRGYDGMYIQYRIPSVHVRVRRGSQLIAG